MTITAAYAGATRTTTLTVNPPGQTATLTVTATGRSGERVTSSPAGINVTVGRQRVGVVQHRDLDHAERLERSRRDLVGRLLERRRQAEDVHVHPQEQRDGHCERAVMFSRCVASGFSRKDA